MIFPLWVLATYLNPRDFAAKSEVNYHEARAYCAWKSEEDGLLGAEAFGKGDEEMGKGWTFSNFKSFRFQECYQMGFAEVFAEVMHLKGNQQRPFESPSVVVILVAFSFCD